MRGLHSAPAGSHGAPRESVRASEAWSAAGLLRSLRRARGAYLPAALVAAGGLSLVLSAIALLDVVQLRDLIYHRPAIERGDWWRLLSSSFVHATWRHLVWDLAGLALLAFIFRRAFSELEWYAVVLVAAAGSQLGVFVANPSILSMAGLSGLLHGLWAAGAVAHVTRGGKPTDFLWLALLIVKITLDLTGPTTPSSHALGGRLAIDAHLWGAVSGAAVAALITVRQTRDERTPQPAASTPGPALESE